MAFTFGTSTTNLAKLQTAEFDSGGSAVLETNIIFFATDLDPEKQVFRCQMTIPGAGLASMMLAQMRHDCEVFPSIRIQVDINNPLQMDDDVPALILPIPNATPFRCVEFRNAVITEMSSDQVKMGTEMAPGKTITYTHKMDNTNLWIESRICIQSSPVSRRDLGMCQDFVSHPPWDGLPFYPGISSIAMATPTGGRKQRLIQWNAFAPAPWTPERHWLYPRSLRRIFFTLLLIRRFGSSSSMVGMDMNILRKIFQEIAAAEGHSAIYPFKLRDEESKKAFAKQRQIYVEAIQDREATDVLEAVCAVPGQSKSIYSGPVQNAPPTATRQGFRFGGQPHVQVQVQQQQQQQAPIQNPVQKMGFSFGGGSQ